MVFVVPAVFAIATATGLGIAHYLTRQEPPFGDVHIGSWVAWPDIGSAAIDPYARAVVSRRGMLPLGSGVGLAFTATHDSAGQMLNGACTYRVRGPVPMARAWTLTVYDAEGAMPANALGRNGFTSREVLRNADGMAEIILSPEVQPGNWLSSPSGGLLLILRLYGTSVSTMTGAIGAANLPTIDRQSCL